MEHMYYMTHLLHCILAVLAGAIGIGMTIFDMPGNTFMLLCTAAFAFFGGHNPGLPYLAMALIVYMLGEIWEAGMSFFGIKREKVSWCAVMVIGIGGFIGTILGTGFFPVLGSFVGGVCGAFVAAFLYTYLETGSKDNALYIAWVSAKVRFLAMLGKWTAGFALGVMLIYMVLFGKCL